MKLSLAVLTLLPTAFAHFILQYPHSLGFDDDNEGNGPCGGFNIPQPLTADANTTNVTVDSFAISVQTSHPQTSFLFRATLSTSAPYNWTNILPVVAETSIGQFCLPTLKVPSSYAGKTGLIQVIGDAVDGYLYQCAVVNFVEGSNTTVGASCTNATGLTATITNQENFTMNATSSGSATGSASPSATSHSAATMVLQNSGFLGAAFAVIGAVFML